MQAKKWIIDGDRLFSVGTSGTKIRLVELRDILSNSSGSRYRPSIDDDVLASIINPEKI